MKNDKIICTHKPIPIPVVICYRLWVVVGNYKR